MKEVKPPDRPDVPTTVVDRVVSYFNPVAGAKRFHARAMLAIAGGYVGASRSRRPTKEWRTSGGSADADLLIDLPTLRDRSRDLIRNEPLAAGAINTVVTSVVGAGLTVKPSIDRVVLEMDEAEAEAWEQQAAREFRLWGESTECDITGTQVFTELQDLAFRSTLENGDTFALMAFKERSGSLFGTKVQLIEADRVANPQSKADTATLKAGVELDDDGRAVAFHVMKTHPGDRGRINRQTDRVPALSKSGRRLMLHLYRKLRIGQNRGVPYLSAVIEPLKQLGRYTEAELMAAVVAGMFTVFVKTENGDADLNPMEPTEEVGGDASDSDYKLANGAMVGLAAGESIETANPGRPNGAFDPFVQAILRQVGVALELPFEILIKHFTKSYSAARTSLLEAWRFFRARRAWLVIAFCQPVYETVIEEAIARGRLAAPGFFDDELIRKAYLGTRWSGPAPGQIDPQKEAQAAVIRVENGFSTLDEETTGLTGGDWQQNHRQQVKEKKARDEDGLNAQAAPPPDPDDPDEQDDQNNPDDEGDNDFA